MGAERISELSSNCTMKDRLRARTVSSSLSSESTAVGKDEMEEGGGDDMCKRRVEDDPDGGGTGIGEGDQGVRSSVETR